MGDDFGIGSLAALLVDFVDNQPERKPEIRFDFVDYETYIKSPEWKEKAKQAKARAGYRCQVCNCAEHLEAHHRTYDRLGFELDTDITVLCDTCHEKVSKPRKSKQHVAVAIPF